MKETEIMYGVMTQKGDFLFEEEDFGFGYGVLTTCLLFEEERDALNLLEKAKNKFKPGDLMDEEVMGFREQYQEDMEVVEVQITLEVKKICK